MTTFLNALINNQISVDVAAVSITATDVAHHVIDPDDVLGLNPLAASDLEIGLARLVEIERDTWHLALPEPGALGALRGPLPFNNAALEAGEAVVASTSEIGLVPHAVGRAVQWRAFRANRPFAPLSPYEAERALSETILTAASTLAALEVSSGTRPDLDVAVELAPGYGRRQRSAAERAARLLAACDLALADAGGAISAFETEARLREIHRVRTAANQALCSACAWIGE